MTRVARISITAIDASAKNIDADVPTVQNEVEPGSSAWNHADFETGQETLDLVMRALGATIDEETNDNE